MKTKLKAATVIECVVASVILMLVFMAVMEILVRMSVRGRRTGRHLEMVVALKECRRDFSVCLPGAGEVVTRSYPWGAVSAEAAPYARNVSVLVLKAATGEGREITLRYLVDTPGLKHSESDEDEKKQI